MQSNGIEIASPLMTPRILNQLWTAPRAAHDTQAKRRRWMASGVCGTALMAFPG
jgi:hypothetical protein